ncbi:DNA-binding protein (plasmid) [Amycolatopsis sp. AA4]|uniref:helix-turn-helix domain-containing protein n=1 Tax=Actinomycetes TaxID=1760 RepID=UPI0001B57BD8|nr:MULTISPECIES: helix-turn-helix domain-containing protein [Actinomycetes]ATY17279.1 DNA-binding protein [Amycolatopsis sp. AA4]
MSTTLAGANDRAVLMTDERDQRQAAEVVRRLPAKGRALFRAEASGSAVEVPPELSAIIAQVVQAVAAGRAVTVSSLPEELTTTEAAKILGISRPTLMRKIDAGEIPARKVGTHTRLRTRDVLAERSARRQRQLAAFDELRALEDD